MPPSRPFVVLNPGGRDPDQDFAGGAGQPGAPGHPPVNFHAFAACMRGSFRRKVAGVEPGAAVLLLLRPRHLSQALESARRLRKAGSKVIVSWKEAGWLQVQEALAPSGRWSAFCELASHCDGALCPVPDLAPLFRAAGFAKIVHLPTPYPLEESAWDFSTPLAQRQGIFLGTRQFQPPERGHRIALAVAASLGVPLTVIATGGGSELRLIQEVAPNAQIVRGPLPYPDYLRVMSRARLVFQLDRSRVPGQVAGDALLCRMPCAGGDSAIERLAFPELCGWGREVEEILNKALLLLQNDAAWEAAVADSQNRALSHLSFSAARKVLTEIFA